VAVPIQESRSKWTLTSCSVMSSSCGFSARRGERLRDRRSIALLQLARATLGHRPSQWTGTCCTSSSHGNRGRGNGFHARDFLLPKNIYQTVARKPISGQRPDHEEVASVPGRGINQSSWFRYPVGLVPARRARISQLTPADGAANPPHPVKASSNRSGGRALNGLEYEILIGRAWNPVT
jgi:hypothetical protein